MRNAYKAKKQNNFEVSVHVCKKLWKYPLKIEKIVAISCKV